MHRPLLTAGAIWRIADLLRGALQPDEYGPVILAFTVLRRMEQARTRPAAGLAGVAQAVDGPATFETLLARLPRSVQSIMTQLDVRALAHRLAQAELLGAVAAHFAALDLAPAHYGTEGMARLFEELVHHFTTSRGTGVHYTPPEVTDLMVDLVFATDTVPTRHDLYDPAAGTGALLGRAADRLQARGMEIRLFGQELGQQSCALCRADLLLRGQSPAQITQGNTLTEDGHGKRHFARMLANPPFGLDWRNIRSAIQAEHARGPAGRFPAGLPRLSDGSMLFMQHLLAKMRSPRHGGSRVGVVTHAGALSGGGAESGESAIRRYLVEHDLIDAIIALPMGMFVNTGIATYVWILDNHKPATRQGKVRLIDASFLWRRAMRSSGEKRREMTPGHLSAIMEAYMAGAEMDVVLHEGEDGAAEHWDMLAADAPQERVPCHDPDAPVTEEAKPPVPNDQDTPFDGGDGIDWPSSSRRVGFSRIVAGRDFLYRSLVVERPVHDDAPTRTVFLTDMAQDPHAWFVSMIRPHDAEARLDMARAQVGCAISFPRYFHRPAPHRPVEEIVRDLHHSMDRLAALMPDMTGKKQAE